MRIVERDRRRVRRSVEIEDTPLVLPEWKRNQSGKGPDGQHELSRMPETSRGRSWGGTCEGGGERSI